MSWPQVGLAIAAVLIVANVLAPLYRPSAPRKPTKAPKARPETRELVEQPSAPFTEEYGDRSCTLCGTTKGVTVRAKPSRVGNGILTICACKSCFEKYT